ncbi:MetQ/NlpA family ABC transporter substrate-binding protein [Chitinasiproducens palmae]|uniref:D-methionine transport system substrate-binding protein n=1 Tax=Chitinasiproducens palmae TaxID=1770053 RepID=A0A1H2PQ95_9BURK|nr:MetQ/NlpA family ABC transporter substrate-binding protein [Chitinasiproducens palmae]SDV48994.1 D-methionine transport system substrate-binding protein [Chitinasiproducens palmae]
MSLFQRSADSTRPAPRAKPGATPRDTRLAERRRARLRLAGAALAALAVAAGITFLAAGSRPASAADASKRELRIGATAGPYADQVRYGIKPTLEKQGYRVTIVEFSDYVQPNLALAEGALDANVFQHEVYLRRFAEDRKLRLSELIKVPTAPIGLYSRRHKSLDEVRDGATVSLPNDATNQARAIILLQQIGWVTLKPGVDPVKSSERDIGTNPHHIKLLPLEAAQLPRSLDDVDYALVNGNFALAAGLKLDEALQLEQIPSHYLNLVAVRTDDLNKPFAKDIVAAYRSPAFRQVIDTRFQGFDRPPYLRN